MKHLSNIPTKKIIRLFEFLGFTFILLLFPAPNIYFHSVSGNKEPINIEIPKPPPIPINTTKQEAPNLSAQGILIIDLGSNVVIYQKNAKERFNPASTTKILTALVALDYYKLDDVLTVNKVITEGRTMSLVSGEKLTFESLLYGALVHSANDAAYAIAENYPGGVAKFVEAMNKKAAELDLSSSHFTNPIGFDDDQMYTTAEDLAKLARVALTNKLVAKIVGTKNITVSDVSYTYFHSLENVNELLGKIPGVAGVKTGYTENGGEILVSEVKKNDHTVLFVLLKSENRFKETETMINWVFGNFSWRQVTDVIPTNQEK